MNLNSAQGLNAVTHKQRLLQWTNSIYMLFMCRSSVCFCCPPADGDIPSQFLLLRSWIFDCGLCRCVCGVFEVPEAQPDVFSLQHRSSDGLQGHMISRLHSQTRLNAGRQTDAPAGELSRRPRHTHLQRTHTTSTSQSRNKVTPGRSSISPWINCKITMKIRAGGKSIKHLK